MLGYAYIPQMLPKDTVVYVCESNDLSVPIINSFSVTTTNKIQRILGQGEGTIRRVSRYGESRDFDITSADEVLIEAISYAEDESYITLKLNVATDTLFQNRTYRDTVTNRMVTTNGLLYTCELSD